MIFWHCPFLNVSMKERKKLFIKRAAKNKKQSIAIESLMDEIQSVFFENRC